MTDFDDIPVSQDSDLYFDAVETLTLEQPDDIEFEYMSSTSESERGVSLDEFANDDDGTETKAMMNEVVVDLSLTDKAEGVVHDGSREDDVVENDGVSGEGEDGGKVRLQGKVLKPRNYQLEMLGESLKRNIIVAMDTGSGKTHIAVMRIAAELERSPPDKLVWFMAPTVALCEQQYLVLEREHPFVQIKFLSGADNVDRWSTQALWDAVLLNVRVVVSTYQILLDALTHAFVPMSRIALLVFDEAHNCVKSSPGSRIMRDFYMPRFLKDYEVPHILGLSASPIMNSSILSVEKIEKILNAICRTPSKHRAELLQQVKLPEMKHVVYMPLPEPEELESATITLASLHKVYNDLNIHEDPYVKKLKSENTEKSARKLKKAFESRGTYCQDQFKSLCTTSTVIYHELGGWAADFYIENAISRFTNIAESTASYLERFDLEEKSYLAAALKKVQIFPESMDKNSAINVSDKVNRFIETLLQVYHPGISGIVFVRQRATVAVLAHLLSSHPDTKDLFTIGTFVGTSQDPRRITNIGDMLDTQNQWKALEDFRSGSINLIVATSALEEGIDVPACNTVLCFNEPDNLKVLVQRRGRARSQESKLILMVDGENDKVHKWLEFEKEMKKVYADDMRTLKDIRAMEDLHEDGHREFRIETTGALLNLDNAVQHLYHFCATIPTKEYVDLRPDFICEKICESKESYVRAKVILPTCVDENCREAESQQSWPSESDAFRDVAFEACMKLYHAGLINDHLLPLPRDASVPEGFEKGIENRSSQINVSEQFDPWISIAKLWSHQSGQEKMVNFHKFDVRVTTERGILLSEMRMIIPSQLPDLPPISIYWDARTTLIVTIQPLPLEAIRADDISRGRIETAAIIKAAYGHRFSCDRVDFPAIFMANSPMMRNLLRNPEHKVASDLSFPSNWDNDPLLVRDTLNSNRPCLYHKWLASKPASTTIRKLHQHYEDFEQDAPYLALKPLPKRADFLHTVPSQNELPSSDKPYHYVLPASVCMVDKLPFSLIQFGLFLPCILHRIQVQMVASTLASSLLHDVALGSLQRVIMAISAPVAREQENYQRLEFLGDSVLKFCTSVQLLITHPAWHEGYLSGQKDRFVCNARLSRAAVESGLDKFILTKPFTGNKWRPTYISDLIEIPQDGTREMSTKMLADVVEALLGAAMLDGGFSKAVACLRVLVPEPDLQWMPINTNRDGLFKLAPADMELPTTLIPLEELIRYSFQKKALLVESMTHVSHTMAKASLERLEFLGDSVLDSIIVDQVFNHTKQLPVWKMHLLRTALVNADFLAFMCMELAIDQEKVEKLVERGHMKQFREIRSTLSLPLWTFMRHSSPQISKVQKATMERYRQLRDEIKQAINTSDHYPWIALARLRAPKFFSDLVESLLGAIWIDSGSFETCSELLERMQILPYLRRIVDDDVHLWHPKEELGQLSVTEKVKYVVGTEKRKWGEEGKKLFCEVFVGDKLIAREGEWEGERELLLGVVAERAVGLIKGEKVVG